MCWIPAVRFEGRDLAEARLVEQIGELLLGEPAKGLRARLGPRHLAGLDDLEAEAHVLELAIEVALDELVAAYDGVVLGAAGHPPKPPLAGRCGLHANVVEPGQVERDERPASLLQVCTEAPQGPAGLLHVAQEHEGPEGHEDRPISSLEGEALHRGVVKDDMEASSLRLVAADREHVLGEIQPLHVQPIADEGEQEAARAARGLERRLAAVADRPPKELDVLEILAAEPEVVGGRGEAGVAVRRTLSPILHRKRIGCLRKDWRGPLFLRAGRLLRKRPRAQPEIRGLPSLDGS